ncbi:MAG: hypothetical protein ACTSYS_10935 [Promethearchaeota archaeon]
MILHGKNFQATIDKDLHDLPCFGHDRNQIPRNKEKMIQSRVRSKTSSCH